MAEFTRRSFLSGVGMLGAAGALGVISGCTPNAAAGEEAPKQAEAQVGSSTVSVGDGPEVVLSDGTVWRGTPKEIAEKGGSTMPLEELTRRRKEYVDAQTEFVAEDGTVVPAPYVKMRALIHTYGMGCGEGDLTLSMFSRIMQDFTEEQVEAYLDMPWDRKFTANEFYYKSQREGKNRTYEECKELCEQFSKKRLLPFRTINEGRTYNIPSCAPEGILTYNICDEYYADPASYEWPLVDWDLSGVSNLMGTPPFMSVPLNKEVVAEDNVLLAYDDVDTMIEDHEYLAVQPCSCRYETYVFECHEKGESFPTFGDFCSGESGEFLDSNGDRIETCIAMGDDAEYLVSLGLARRITKEEAHELVQRGREDNFILHCLHGKEHAWLCMCNPAVCGIISRWTTGAEEIGGWDVLQEKSVAFNHRSHYELAVDFDKCIKCGTCSKRCPMEAIAMDGEGGSPQVTDHLCQRCGQCAYVCPMEARKLEQRSLDEFVELPHQLEDDNNLKGAYRFEHNLIGYSEGSVLEAYKA